MMARRGFPKVVVYLDDFLIIEKTYEECKLAFDMLCSLLIRLGFTISPTKLVCPCQKLVFLGVEIDTTTLSFSLPQRKLTNLKDCLIAFCHKTRATKRQLQQLAGRLNWACRVVYGGRTFLRRILTLMNSLQKQSAKCLLTKEFFKDIDWWLRFLEVFNGLCPFHDLRPVKDLHTDACSSGVGASFQGDWFYSNLLVDYPDLSSMHINYKEALGVYFAIERWAPLLKDKTVHIHCDNTSVVAMLNEGTTANPCMMSYLRRLFWLSARFNFRLRCFHVPGKLNVLADNISRLHMPAHFLAFMRHLQTTQGSSALGTIAAKHMSCLCYLFLLGLYSTSLSFYSAF